MMYEYELKYRTNLSESEFRKLVTESIYYSNVSDFEIGREYNDTFFYRENINYFLRLRKELDPGFTNVSQMTFKEENGNNSKRKEVNVAILNTSDKAETVASILGLSKSFSISKKAFIYEIKSLEADISWYEVDGKDKFLEIEWTGDQNKEGVDPMKVLDRFDSVMEIIFGDELEREYKSLFKIYKPQPEEYVWTIPCGYKESKL